MKLGELLNHLAIQAGVENSNTQLKDLLANPVLLEIQVSDEISDKMKSNLMTEEQAKQNYNIKNHYYGQALKGVEAEIESAFDEFKIGDDGKASIQSEKSSYKKIKLLANKVKELEAKKLEDTTGNQKKYIDQITQLNQEIANVKASTTVEKGELEKKYNEILKEKDLQVKIGGYNLTKQFPRDTVIKTAHSLVYDEINKKGAAMLYESGQFKLVNSKDHALPYMENNQPVKFDDFISKVIADNKLLEIASTAATTTTTTTTSGRSDGGGTNYAKELLKQQVKDFAMSPNGQ